MSSNTTRAMTYEVLFCETTLSGPRMWTQTFTEMDKAYQELNKRSDTLMVKVMGVHKGYSGEFRK